MKQAENINRAKALIPGKNHIRIEKRLIQLKRAAATSPSHQCSQLVEVAGENDVGRLGIEEPRAEALVV